MFCLEFNLLSDILFYKKSIKVFVVKWFTEAPFAFRFVDGFISFNLEVSDKSIFGYKVNKVFCRR